MNGNKCNMDFILPIQEKLGILLVSCNVDRVPLSSTLVRFGRGKEGSCRGGALTISTTAQSPSSLKSAESVGDDEEVEWREGRVNSSRERCVCCVVTEQRSADGKRGLRVFSSDFSKVDADCFWGTDEIIEFESCNDIKKRHVFDE